MAETIKEFLVGLGYSVDGASESKFLNSVGSATKTVGYLGLSVTAAATAVGAAVTKIAANFDTIYYTAQRTQASVQNLKSVGYAVAQLGGSYSGALASIENFAQKMRSNPGIESLANKLGVATRENGKLRETTSIVQDLTKALAKRPPHIALQYLDLFGIDERTYNAMRSGDFQKFADEYAEKSRRLGVDQKKAAEIGRDLTRAWYALGATGELIGAKLEQTLGRSMASFVKDIDDFLLKNADAIVAFFAKLGEVTGQLSTAFKTVVTALTPLWEGFDELAKRFTGQHGLTVLVEGFIALKLATWLWGVAAAITGVGAAAGGALLGGGLARFFGLLTGVGAFALGMTPSTANGGEDAEIARRRANGTWGSTPNDGAARPQRQKDNSWTGRLKRWWSGDKGQGTTSSAIPVEGRALLDTIASTEANSYNVRYGGQKFDSYTDHPRQGATITSGPNAGKQSTAAGRYQFLAATWDSQAKKLGLKDFSPASQDIAAYDLAKTVYRQSTGRSLEADLKSDDPKVIAGIGSALAGTWTSLPGGIEQGQNSGRFNRSFNRFLDRQRAASQPAVPADQGSPFIGAFDPKAFANVQANAALIGGGGSAGTTPPIGIGASSGNSTNVEMNQRTEITVLGGSDPSATASAVGDAQKGVNGGLLRNMTGAVR